MDSRGRRAGRRPEEERREEEEEELIRDGMKGRLALLASLGGMTGKARRGRPLPRVNGMGEKGSSRGKALIKPGSM